MGTFIDKEPRQICHDCVEATMDVVLKRSRSGSETVVTGARVTLARYETKHNVAFVIVEQLSPEKYLPDSYRRQLAVLVKSAALSKGQLSRQDVPFATQCKIRELPEGYIAPVEDLGEAAFDQNVLDWRNYQERSLIIVEPRVPFRDWVANTCADLTLHRRQLPHDRKFYFTSWEIGRPQFSGLSAGTDAWVNERIALILSGVDDQWQKSSRPAFFCKDSGKIRSLMEIFADKRPQYLYYHNPASLAQDVAAGKVRSILAIGVKTSAQVRDLLSQQQIPPNQDPRRLLDIVPIEFRTHYTDRDDMLCAVHPRSTFTSI